MTARAVTFQCNACRALVSATSVALDVDRERAGLLCAACGAGSWLPIAGAGAARAVAPIDAEDPVRAEPAAPPGEGATALVPAGRGGAALVSTALVPTPIVSTAGAAGAGLTGSLSAAQREAIGQRLRALPAPADGQRDLADGFERLLERWADDAEHKQLLRRASLQEELAFAGQRYRAVLDAIPNEPRAKKAQSDILGLAMAAMGQTRDLGSPGEPPKKRLALAAAFAFLMVALAAVLFLSSRLLRGVGGEAMIEERQD
jgi:hypothetical protein